MTENTGERGRSRTELSWREMGHATGTKLYPTGTKLFVRDHFAEVGDVVLDSGDLLRPGNQTVVGYSGSVLSLGFGKRRECVLQLLLQGGAGHRERLSLGQV